MRLRLPGLLLSLSPLLLLVHAFRGEPEALAVPAPPKPEKDSIVTVTISFVGDLMCHSPMFNAARQDDGSYDFNPLFSEVKPILEASDYAIGNLETTFAGASKGFAGYPAFNTPDSYAQAIKNAGFDMVGTSNNHSMDTGEEGLLRTLDQLDAAGLAHTGTYRTQHDRDSVRIVNLKGLKIGILNYTYGTNGAYPSADHKYMLNVADSALVTQDAALARKQGAELVVVFYHWGIEYHPEPVSKQDSMFQYTRDAGADLIIGSHPHVVGPVEPYKTKQAKLDSGLVAWTMGNFVSNQSSHYTDAGLILNIELTKNVTKDSCWISKASYVPTWVYRAYNPANKNYQALPSQWSDRDSLPDFISADLKSKMATSFSETKAIVNKRSAKAVVKDVK